MRVWSDCSLASVLTVESLMLRPPLQSWLMFRVSGKFGGRLICSGIGLFLGCFGVLLEVSFSVEVCVGAVSEMECSIRATAWAHISPVRRHWILGQTVSMSVSEWIFTVTRVGLGLAPARRFPVMTEPLRTESITDPCLKRSLPALFAFQPAAFAIHFSVISMF